MGTKATIFLSLNSISFSFDWIEVRSPKSEKVRVTSFCFVAKNLSISLSLLSLLGACEILGKLGMEISKNESFPELG